MSERYAERYAERFLCRFSVNMLHCYRCAIANNKFQLSLGWTVVAIEDMEREEVKTQRQSASGDSRKGQGVFVFTNSWKTGWRLTAFFPPHTKL